ncbi:MAG: hypothetical protein AAFY17_03750 [Cyanobacteria bacterium J06642_11]
MKTPGATVTGWKQTADGRWVEDKGNNSKGKRKGNIKHDPIINGLPGRVFAFTLFTSSICLNVYNVYRHFAPASFERFIASGIFQFLEELPAFGFIGFLFRLGSAAAAFFIFKQMRKHKLGLNPVWWMMFATSIYFTLVGLANVLLTLPFLLAMALVGGLQYFEIIFWNARRKSVFLWLVVLAAYTIEVWLQYDMLPFHADYDSALGLVTAMTGLSFNWQGFMPIQCIFAAIGIFGIEAGERLLGIVDNYA